MFLTHYYLPFECVDDFCIFVDFSKFLFFLHERKRKCSMGKVFVAVVRMCVGLNQHESLHNIETFLMEICLTIA